MLISVDTKGQRVAHITQVKVACFKALSLSSAEASYSRALGKIYPRRAEASPRSRFLSPALPLQFLSLVFTNRSLCGGERSALKIRPFICPKMFFGRCLVEVIVLSRSIVSLCKAMYQRAFLSIESSLNWVVGNDRS